MHRRLFLVRPAEPRRSIARRIGIGLACVVVCLVLIGQGIFLAQVIANAQLSSGGPTVALPRGGSLAHRLNVALSAALGSSDRGVRRFTITSIHPDSGNPRQSVVAIRWAINSDIGAGTVGNGAQLDVYAMLRNIYSSHPPVARVLLTGTYPIPDKRGSNREPVVMQLAMDRSVADVIGRDGWDTVDAQAIWPLVHRIWVNADFQPLASE